MGQQPSSGRRTALVTGAAQGLGAAIALALARDGYDLALTSTRESALAPTLGAVEGAGARAIGIALDLADVSAIEPAVKQIVSTLGVPDALINNAGVNIRSWALETTAEQWQSTLDINLKAAFFLSQRLARRWVAAARGGSIVSIASTHGLVGYPQRAAYGIAKAGMMQMTRALAVEWAGYGIRVNAIAPGTVDTPSREAHFSADPAAREAIVSRVPLRRFAEMAEVAAAVCYLVSPAAQYVTGHTLVLDGGLTAQ